MGSIWDKLKLPFLKYSNDLNCGLEKLNLINGLILDKTLKYRLNLIKSARKLS